MKPNTIIFNSATWDGKFAREIALAALGGRENCFVVDWEVGNSPMAFPAEGNVYVLGLDLSHPFGVGVDKPYDCEHLWDRLTWIHNDPVAIDDTAPGVPGYRVQGVAVCRLAWQWFVVASRADKEDGHPLRLCPADFFNGEVAEPQCLQYIQGLHGEESKDFCAGLETGIEIDWGRLLRPEDSKLIESYEKHIISLGKKKRTEQHPVTNEVSTEKYNAWKLRDGAWVVCRAGERSTPGARFSIGATLLDAAVKFGAQTQLPESRVCKQVPLLETFFKDLFDGTPLAICSAEDGKNLLVKALIGKVPLGGIPLCYHPPVPVSVMTLDEMTDWLDTLEITSDNIGDIRRALFLPHDCPWNEWVRMETADRENNKEH